MKNLVIVVLLLLGVYGTAVANGNDTANLTVVVTNLQNKDGKVSVSLYKTEEDFLQKGQSLTTIITKAGQATVVFKDLRPGTYAVSVMHDQNDNGKLDTAVFGIPVEPYGFSNNARGTFGPASFDDSKFIIQSDHKIEIKVE